jgi:fructose-1,6-bisphosphatase
MDPQYRRKRFCGNYFSVYRRITPLGTPNYRDFLQPGTSQVAAADMWFTEHQLIVYTTGYGVNGYVKSGYWVILLVTS